MKYSKAKVSNLYLQDTTIENIFINEYLPSAPGDFAKVYIYASMYAQSGHAMEMTTMCGQLDLPESRIHEAWDYWEKMGAVNRIFEKDRREYTVAFVNLKELLYMSDGPMEEPEEMASQGHAQAIGEPADAEKAEGMANSQGSGGQKAVQPGSQTTLSNKDLKELLREVEKLMRRPLDTGEMQQIALWSEEGKAAPEVILYCAAYCVDKGKFSLRYIEKVLETWEREGVRSVEDAEKLLENHDQKAVRQKRILSSLGLRRNPTEKEGAIIDSWFDEMGFEMEKILEACDKTAGISNPNINYVNKVLTNWKSEAETAGRGVNDKKPVSRGTLNRYYDYLREQAAEEAERRKEEVYAQLPEIRTIDENINRVGVKLSRTFMMSGSADSTEARELNEKMEALMEERAVMLTDNNYPMDYTDTKYHCELCNDTGVTAMGERCSCLELRMEEAEIWQREREKSGK